MLFYVVHSEKEGLRLFRSTDIIEGFAYGITRWRFDNHWDACSKALEVGNKLGIKHYYDSYLKRNIDVKTFNV